jgi:hypothetical protein
MGTILWSDSLSPDGVSVGGLGIAQWGVVRDWRKPMPYYYSDPSREAELHALPDVEVFEATNKDSWAEGKDQQTDEHNWYTDLGYYYAFGFPGCLWDSDPVGPFETEAEALKAIREG